MSTYLLRLARHQSYGYSLTGLEVLHRDGEPNLLLLLWLTSLLPGASWPPAITDTSPIIIIVLSSAGHPASGRKLEGEFFDALYLEIGALYLGLNGHVLFNLVRCYDDNAF
jgi:hypothetical protein